jgi:hypothetical protein
VLAGLAASAPAAELPLVQGDFHSRVTCATGIAYQECRNRIDRNATIECPGRKAFAGFREPGKKFHVWCESRRESNTSVG